MRLTTLCIDGRGCGVSLGLLFWVRLLLHLDQTCRKISAQDSCVPMRPAVWWGGPEFNDEDRLLNKAESDWLLNS